MAVTSMSAEELIADVQRLAGQFGKLADQNMMSYPDVMKIIEHFDLKIDRMSENHTAKVQELTGRIGGLQKKLNAKTK